MPPKSSKKTGHIGFPGRIEKLIPDGRIVILAEKTGLSDSRIHHMLDGKEPSRLALESIVKGTGCNAHWLITGEGEPFGDEKSPPAEAEGQVDSLPTPNQAPLCASFERLLLALAALARYAQSQHNPEFLIRALHDLTANLAKYVEAPPAIEDAPPAVPPSHRSVSSS